MSIFLLPPATLLQTVTESIGAGLPGAILPHQADLPSALLLSGWLLVATMITWTAGGSGSDANPDGPPRSDPSEDSARESGDSDGHPIDQLARELMAATSDGVFITEPTGTIIDVNDAAIEALGRRRDELVGTPWQNLFAPDEPTDPGDSWRRLLRRSDGGYLTAEGSSRSLNGGLLLIVWRVVRGAGTEPGAIEAIRRRFEAIATAVDGIIYEWNIDAGTSIRSRALTQHFHFPPGLTDSSPDWWLSLIHPDDRLDVEGAIAEALRSRGEISLEYRVRDGQGVYRRVSDHGVILRDESGRAVTMVGCLLDADRAGRSEVALAEWRTRFRQLADAMPLMVWSARADGFIDFYNRKWFEYTGHDPLRADDRSWSRALHPDDVESFSHTWRHAVERGRDYELEVRFRECATGRYRWHLSRAIPVRDAEGTIVSWYGTNTDVDTLKRVQSGLSRQLDLMRMITDHAADAIFLMDPDGRVTFANPAAERIFGWRQSELVGRVLHDVVHHSHPDGTPYPMSECPIGTVFTSGESITGHEDVFFTRDGRMIDVICSNSCIMVDGVTSGAVLLVQDNTGRKLAERERAELLARERAAHAEAERARLHSTLLAEIGEILATTLDDGIGLERIGRLLVEHLAEMVTIFVVDEAGRVRVESLLHADPEMQPALVEMISRNVDETGSKGGILNDVLRTGRPRLVDAGELAGLESVLPDDVWEPMVRLGIFSALTVPVIARGQTLGAIMVARSASRPPFDEEEFALVQDVARRTAAALDNTQLYAAMRQANAAKDQFLAALSHELRTPLTPVLASVHALGEESLPEELRPYLDIIQRNIELEIRLIDDLLDLTRIINGKLALSRAEVPVTSLVRDVLDICRPEIGHRDLLLVIDLEATPMTIVGDPARLQQVLWNLIRNAIKFTRDGCTITVSAGRSGTDVVITVVDDGIGIPAERLPAIFDAFEQGGPNTHRRYGGLGLGLAITRSIVLMHGGRIEVRSDGEGTGATFTVTLPLHESDDPAEGEMTIAHTRRGVAVLDSPGDTVSIARLVLEQVAGHVAIAHRAPTLRRALEMLSPELIVVDMDADPAGAVSLEAGAARALVIESPAAPLPAGSTLAGAAALVLAKPLSGRRVGEAIAALLG